MMACYGVRWSSYMTLPERTHTEVMTDARTKVARDGSVARLYGELTRGEGDTIIRPASQGAIR